MGMPEAAQDIQGGLWQWHKSVSVAFGVTDMDAVAGSINVRHRQGQSFAEALAQAVQREIEHPVAQRMGGCEKSLRLFDGDDIGQA